MAVRFGFKHLMTATGLFGVGLVGGMVLRPAAEEDGAVDFDDARVQELQARIDAAEAKAMQRRAAMSVGLRNPPVPREAGADTETSAGACTGTGAVAGARTLPGAGFGAVAPPAGPS